MMIWSMLAIAVSTLFFVGVRESAADEVLGTQQCSQGDGECLAEQRARPNAGDPLPADTPVTVHMQNHSPHRADVHFDDGRFGKVSGTVDSGGTIRLNSFPGHRFFVTRHGVRDGLVDPATNEQYFFTVKSDERQQEFAIPREGSPSTTRCRDRYPVCEEEATRGECTRNPGWMIVNCCGSCDEKEGYGELIDSSVRCTPERLNSTVPAWEAGSLDALFASWATDPRFREWEPSVVSSPEKVHGAEHDGPWIMTFDSFLSDFEIGQLIRGGRMAGFERSTDKGRIVGSSGEREKMMSQSRTSTNAWCRGECEALPGVQSVSKRIEQVTGIPEKNYESFQILKYEEGQFYRRHHDSSDSKRGAVAGHRILTFFLYLNDMPEGSGGETRFTTLGVSVRPKKGRALVWPSVLNEDPHMSDSRMFHEAVKVESGTKYAANHWIHQYDFRTANLWGCSGSFA